MYLIKIVIDYYTMYSPGVRTPEVKIWDIIMLYVLSTIYLQ